MAQRAEGIRQRVNERGKGERGNEKKECGSGNPAAGYRGLCPQEGRRYKKGIGSTGEGVTEAWGERET